MVIFCEIPVFETDVILQSEKATEFLPFSGINNWLLFSFMD